MKKKNDWLRGYCCCLAIMIKMEGSVQPDHHEAYNGGIGNSTEADLKAAGVDEGDIEVFKQHDLFKQYNP